MSDVMLTEVRLAGREGNDMLGMAGIIGTDGVSL